MKLTAKVASVPLLLVRVSPSVSVLAALEVHGYRTPLGVGFWEVVGMWWVFLLLIRHLPRSVWTQDQGICTLCLLKPEAMVERFA